MFQCLMKEGLSNISNSKGAMSSYNLQHQCFMSFIQLSTIEDRDDLLLHCDEFRSAIP